MSCYVQILNVANRALLGKGLVMISKKKVREAVQVCRQTVNDSETDQLQMVYSWADGFLYAMHELDIIDFDTYQDYLMDIRDEVVRRLN